MKQEVNRNMLWHEPDEEEGRKMRWCRRSEAERRMGGGRERGEDTEGRR